MGLVSAIGCYYRIHIILHDWGCLFVLIITGKSVLGFDFSDFSCLNAVFIF